MTLIHRFSLLCLLWAFSLASTGAELLDRIVAVVNDQPILQSELDEATFSTLNRLRQQGITPPSLDTLRKRVLEQLILEKIQLQRAQARGIRIPDDAVNAQLATIARQNGLDLETFRQALSAQQPGAFEQLRDTLRKQLTIDRLRQIEVVSRVQVTQTDVEQLLKQQAGGSLDRYHLRHILIALPSAPTKDQVAEAKAKADQLYQQLQDGADFAALAVKHSDGQNALKGGDLGWLTANQLPDLFIDAISTLKPGQVTPPLKSASGYHLLKLEGHDQTAASETDRQQAMQTLRLRKANELFDLWLRRLRDEAHVEIYLDDPDTLKP